MKAEMEEKVNKAYIALRTASEMSHEFYGEPLMICFSGGKDSDVLLHLARRFLETDFVVQHSHTTVDAPETIYYIRKKFAELNEDGIKTIIDYPHDRNGNPVSMWSLIPKKKLPPTRIVRYCCATLKETAGEGRIIATGIRGPESLQRKSRNYFDIVTKTKKDAKAFSLEHAVEVFEDAMEIKNEPFVEAMDCALISTMRRKKKVVVNPLFDWTEEDIWEYIRIFGIEVNPLYAMGFKRVGCIGCPMAGTIKQKHEFEMWPRYRELYLKAFGRMLQARKAAGLETKWKNENEVMDWWLSK